MKKNFTLALIPIGLLFLGLQKNNDCDCNYLNSKLKEYLSTNSDLTTTKNTLKFSNDKLTNQLQEQGKKIISLTNQLMNSETEVSRLTNELKNKSNELSQKNQEVGRLTAENDQIKKELKNRSTLTEKEVLELRRKSEENETNLKSIKFDIDKQTTEFTGLQNRNKDLEALKDSYEKRYKEMESESKDFIHIKEQQIFFMDKSYTFDENIISFDFKPNETSLILNVKQKYIIDRLTTLISKYDYGAKINFIVGSIANTKQDRKILIDKRTSFLKGEFLAIKEPFNISESSFSTIETIKTNHSIEVQISKK